MEVRKLSGLVGLFLHEDTKGTQGPGHFTVRLSGPLYRAHPLRLYCFLEKTQYFVEVWMLGGLVSFARRFICRPLVRRSVLRFPFSGAASPPLLHLLKRIAVRPQGRVCAPLPKRGVRSPPRPTGLRAGRAPCAHARPAPCVVLCVPLWSFVFFANHSGSPSLCSSVQPSVCLCVLKYSGSQRALARP